MCIDLCSTFGVGAEGVAPSHNGGAVGVLPSEIMGNICAIIGPQNGPILLNNIGRD